jgi:hypothetical protein
VAARATTDAEKSASPRGEISLGAPAEHTLGSRTVSSDVPYVAEPVLARHHDRSCGLTAPDGRQLFAACLRRRIDAARIECCRVRYQFGTQLSAADRAQRVETPSLKIVPPARRRTNNAALGAGVPSPLTTIEEAYRNREMPTSAAT